SGEVTLGAISATLRTLRRTSLSARGTARASSSLEDTRLRQSQRCLQALELEEEETQERATSHGWKELRGSVRRRGRLADAGDVEACGGKRISHGVAFLEGQALRRDPTRRWGSCLLAGRFLPRPATSDLKFQKKTQKRHRDPPPRTSRSTGGLGGQRGRAPRRP